MCTSPLCKFDQPSGVPYTIPQKSVSLPACLTQLQKLASLPAYTILWSEVSIQARGNDSCDSCSEQPRLGVRFLQLPFPSCAYRSSSGRQGQLRLPTSHFPGPFVACPLRNTPLSRLSTVPWGKSTEEWQLNALQAQATRQPVLAKVEPRYKGRTPSCP